MSTIAPAPRFEVIDQYGDVLGVFDTPDEWSQNVGDGGVVGATGEHGVTIREIAPAPTPTRYRVTDREGRTIAPRAEVTDHWGETAAFIRVERPAVDGLAARVIVRHHDTRTTGTYYASIYGLTVEPIAPEGESL